VPSQPVQAQDRRKDVDLAGINQLHCVVKAQNMASDVFAFVFTPAGVTVMIRKITQTNV
jgi:hypothetical protein